MRSFDLVLSYPQWQGSGRYANLLRGARAAAEVCGRHGRLVEVPLAGEGIAQGGINRWTSILEQFRSAQKLLNDAAPRSILAAGGDCAVDVAVIDHLHRIYPDLAVIWFDAHLDANTPQTSPSGNFHGMPVAAIMGESPPDMQDLLHRPLPAAQFRYVAAEVGDEGDWQFQKANELKWLEPDRTISGPVHIHFDLDVLDPAAFPFVAYPEGNLDPERALDLVSRIAAEGRLVGLTITEFSPADDAQARKGSRFLARLCEAACAHSLALS